MNENLKLNGNGGRFVCDLRNNRTNREMVHLLLKECNSKDYGQKVTFAELAIAGIKKIDATDIEKLKLDSRTYRERLQRALEDYNRKNNLQLTIHEFAVRQLEID